MREFISKRIKDFKADYIQWAGCIISTILLVCHLWQFFDSGFMIQPLIRVIASFLFIPITFIFGRNIIFYEFLIYAYIITLDIRFNNYTPFIIVTIFCMIKAKSNKIKDNLPVWIPVLTIYATCIFIVCQLHDKDAIHLVIHFINCFIIFFFTWHFVKGKKNIKPLILDESQKRILHDLASGKMQKEIDYYSKNTVSDKIKAAVENNGLMTKEQLLMRFIITNSEYN